MNIMPAPATKRRFVLLAAALFLTAPIARAQTSISTSDIKFMQELSQNGMTELKLAELAVKKGTTDETKDFGRMLLKDRAPINDSLKALALQKSVPLSTGLDEKHQALVDKFSDLPGSELDDTFVIEMVKAHEQDIKSLTDELAATQDTDIQGFAAKSLPVIQADLRHVAGMQKAPVSPVSDIKN